MYIDCLAIKIILTLQSPDDHYGCWARSFMTVREKLNNLIVAGF